MENDLLRYGPQPTNRPQRIDRDQESPQSWLTNARRRQRQSPPLRLRRTSSSSWRPSRAKRWWRRAGRLTREPSPSSARRLRSPCLVVRRKIWGGQRSTRPSFSVLGRRSALGPTLGAPPALQRVGPRESFGRFVLELGGGKSNVVAIHTLALDLGAAIRGACSGRAAIVSSPSRVLLPSAQFLAANVTTASGVRVGEQCRVSLAPGRRRGRAAIVGNPGARRRAGGSVALIAVAHRHPPGACSRAKSRPHTCRRAARARFEPITMSRPTLAESTGGTAASTLSPLLGLRGRFRAFFA